jgi:hypothetical protein
MESYNETVGKFETKTQSGIGLNEDNKVIGSWSISVFDPEGKLISEDNWTNVVTNGGKNYLLDTGLVAQAATTSWFVGLTDGTPTVAVADTLAVHAGWVEVTAYSEGSRQAWTGATAVSQAVTNVASKAIFTINADSTTIGGAFLTSPTLLYAVGAFTGGDVVLSNGSTIEVTAQFSLV